MKDLNQLLTDLKYWAESYCVGDCSYCCGESTKEVQALFLALDQALSDGATAPDAWRHLDLSSIMHSNPQA